MRRKVFSVIAAMALLLTFSGTAVSEDVASDPQALVGRWEGSARGLDNNWSSYYAVEVFHVDAKGKRVMYRYICPECRRAGMFYEIAKLKDDKDKIAFETTWRDPLEFVLKGNYLSGFLSTTGDTGIYRYDYTLKRLADKKQVFDAKELVGEWIWVSGSRWRELIIEEVDTQNKTFKGKYKIDTGKEYPLIEAKIVSFGNGFKIDFWTTNRTTHYQLTYYPNFREYPPVLWGQFERLTGESNYKMFRKKEKRD